MPTSLRIVATVFVCLTIGFVAGRFSVAPPAELTPKSAASPVQPTAQTSAQVAAPPTRAEPLSAPNGPQAHTPAATVAWLKKRNTSIAIMPFADSSFSPILAAILGLAPDEVDQLNLACNRAGKRMDELAIHAATSRSSEDGKTLIVSVPPLTNESGAIYTDFLDSVKQTLGPDRYQLFNELAGDSFDRTFDQFGLNPVTYEMSLAPKTLANGTLMYPVKRAYSEAGSPGRSGWVNGKYSREDIAKTYPVLANFLPEK